MHEPMCPRAQGRDQAHPRRHDHHRLRHLDAPSSRRVLWRRGVPAASAVGPRKPGPRDGVRGDVPARRLSPAAAPNPRHPGRTAPGLDADDGSRPRRAAASWTGRHSRLAARDGGGAEPPVPRACTRSAGFRLVEQAAARCLQRALVRRHHARRNIYLEAPFGLGGFYPRLSGLRLPALFVWGSHDALVPTAFGRPVRTWLPGAEQVTLQACGHVPQVERPVETSDLLMRFFDRPLGAGGRRVRVPAADVAADAA